ncbi:SURF1 family cytochrome oxidase biogenesis protein [Brevibacterium litoralis]|uniref:SURF1 family cytochrome oxidase biogenesis protein n=1 Tax=Brevibacterium litoralis TaxID=3138935 RepID=UPI0032F088CA
MRNGRFGFLLTRRWLTYIALAIVAAAVCGLLSNWQNDRRAQRDAEIDRIETNYGGDLHDITDLLPDTDATLDADDEWKRVELTGHYAVEDTVLARNRTLNAQSGYYVVVPFLVKGGADGTGAGTPQGASVAVARGWVPTDSTAGTPEDTAIPAVPTGTVTLTGWVRPAQDGSGDENPEGLIRAIDPERIPGMEDGYRHVYLEMESEDPAGEQITALPVPDTDPGSHLSYTFQWIVFGVMILGGVGYAAVRERRTLDAEAGGPESGAHRVAGGPGSGDDSEGAAGPDYVVVDKTMLRSRATRKLATGKNQSGRPTSRGEGRYAGASPSRMQRGRKPATAEDVEDALLDEQV